MNRINKKKMEIKLKIKGMQICIFIMGLGM